jgi:hypothetical protein
VFTARSLQKSSPANEDLTGTGEPSTLLITQSAAEIGFAP